MILGVFFTLVLGIFISQIGGVSGQTLVTSCPDTQTLLRISGTTNAHGQTYNAATPYTTEICSTNTITRSNTNPIVRLYGTTNAHAEIISKNTQGYSTIYYGNGGTCSTVPSSNACQAGQTEILTLSSATNAHLGLPGQYTGAGTYRICCTNIDTTGNPACGDGVCNGAETCSTCSTDCGTCNPVPKITQKLWIDLSGNAISSVKAGETVRLFVRTVGMPLGTTISFTIMEQDPIFNDLIDTLSATANAATGIAEVQWTITQAVIDASNDGGLEKYPYGFFYIASGGGAVDGAELPILSVTEPPPQSPQPPVANISAPVHKGIYFKDSPDNVVFSQTGTSGLEYTWTLDPTPEQPGSGDEIINKTGDVGVSADGSFTLNFNTDVRIIPGVWTVTLNVRDPVLDLDDEDQVAILVLASPGTFAFINDPYHKEVIDTNSSSDPLVVNVDYNASDSYVVNVDNVACTANCLSGDCPTTTENFPTGCSANIPITGTPDFSKMSFAWTWEDGYQFTANGATAGGVSGSRIHGAVGDTYVDLQLTYTGVEPGVPIADTRRYFTAGRCVSGGGLWVENNGSRTDTTSSQSACVGPDGVIGGGDDCCTVGSQCTIDGCETGDGTITQCNQYTDQSACENDTFNILEMDPLFNDDNPPGACGSTTTMGELVLCECFWEPNPALSSGTPLANCGLKKTVIDVTDGTGYSCGYNYDTTECQNGFMTVTVNRVFAAGTSGIDPQDINAVNSVCPQRDPFTAVCGRTSVELPFFGMGQFFAAGLILIFVYLFIHVKKRNQ